MFSTLTAPLHLKLKPCGVLIAVRITVVVVILNSRLNPLVFIQESGECW